MFGADYVHISRLRKSGLLQLSLNISKCQLPCHTHTYETLTAFFLDLEDYGVTKKWVIITEISKEVENNDIARLNAYAKKYVPRRTGAAGGSSAGGGSSGRS
jgi:hypothetical protein